MLAIGALIENGLYLHLPVDRGQIKHAFVSIDGAPPSEITPLLHLGSSALGDAVFGISANTRDLFSHASGFLNTDPKLASRTGSTVTLTLSFVAPLSTVGTTPAFHLEDAPFDLFVSRVGDEGHQVHMARYDGSKTGANSSLFGTADDASNRDLSLASGADNTGRHYVTSTGVPFAIDLPEMVQWTTERTAIEKLFPDIIGFGASAGHNNADFYKRPDPGFAYSGGSGGSSRPVPPAPIGLDQGPIFSAVGGQVCLP